MAESVENTFEMGAWARTKGDQINGRNGPTKVNLRRNIGATGAIFGMFVGCACTHKHTFLVETGQPGLRRGWRAGWQPSGLLPS